MSELGFTWDPRKASADRKKHGITFEEAATVFLDEEALLIGDPDHSDDEDRFLILGLSSQIRLLVVCHCLREDKGVIRIITARKATGNERRQYDERIRR